MLTEPETFCPDVVTAAGAEPAAVVALPVAALAAPGVGAAVDCAPVAETAPVAAGVAVDAVFDPPQAASNAAVAADAAPTRKARRESADVPEVVPMLFPLHHAWYPIVALRATGNHLNDDREQRW
jgi:hypothetical protein